MNKAHKIVGIVIFMGAISIGLFDQHQAFGLQSMLERQSVLDQTQACLGTATSAEARQDCLNPDYAVSQSLL